MRAEGSGSGRGPGVILLVLTLIAGGGVWWLAKNRKEMPTGPAVVSAGGRTAGGKAGGTAAGAGALPEESTPGSNALVGTYAEDLPDDVEELKTRYMDLLAEKEVLEALNEQLSEKIRLMESAEAAQGGAAGATEDGMQAEAAQLRGLAFRDHIKVRFAPWDEFRGLVQESLSARVSHQQADNRFRAWAALGLIPAIPEASGLEVLAELEAEQSGGIFLGESRELVVPDTDRALDSPVIEKRRVAAYTRALQEDLLDPQRLPLFDSANDDRAMAAWCLLLGDGASVAMRSNLRRHAGSEEALSAPGITPGREPYQGVAVSAREWMRFPRSMGHWFVEALMARGGNDEVNDAFRKPPGTTAEILHPEYYLNPGTLVVEHPELPTPAPLAGEPYWDNVLGEAGILLLLKLQLPDETALRASDGWRGDRWLVWRSDSAQSDPLWWDTRWFDEQDAKEFFDAMKALLPKVFTLTEVTPETDGSAAWSAAGEGGLKLRLTLEGRRVLFTRLPGEN